VSDADLQFLTHRRHKLAYRKVEGRGPPLVWCGGFASDMDSTKAQALAEWASSHQRAFIRFDYSGHGRSEGRFDEGTIGQWFQDAQTIVETLCDEAPILVGSSMGGWIALLVTRALQGTKHAPRGLVLIAPAVDFTEELMWAEMPAANRTQIETEGVWYRPSLYGDPLPITRALIEDGRQHRLFTGPIHTQCPVTILQGMEDPDVPWKHALRLVEHMPGDDVTLTLIRDGDHRLSRPQDLDKLCQAVANIVQS
jgi:pimeloyl-ACP methyl ester carboxylesterase